MAKPNPNCIHSGVFYTTAKPPFSWHFGIDGWWTCPKCNGQSVNRLDLMVKPASLVRRLWRRLLTATNKPTEADEGEK